MKLKGIQNIEHENFRTEIVLEILPCFNARKFKKSFRPLKIPNNTFRGSLSNFSQWRLTFSLISCRKSCFWRLVKTTLSPKWKKLGTQITKSSTQMLIQLIEKIYNDWELLRFWIRFSWILDCCAAQCFMYPQSKEGNQFFPKNTMTFWGKLEIHVTLELFTDKWKRTGVFVIFTPVSVVLTLFPPSLYGYLSSGRNL